MALVPTFLYLDKGKKKKKAEKKDPKPPKGLEKFLED